MMIEQNTNYAYKLKSVINPSFKCVWNLAKSFIKSLPQTLQNDLHNELKNGVVLLDSEPLMAAYMFSYGQMHEAKLKYAYKKIPKEFFQQKEINIIDYGCGQALGTLCYADFLHENDYVQMVKSITLIEPSERCLQRAALHASVFFPNVTIKTVNKKFDALSQEDFVCDGKRPTLHILSNVLDIQDFKLERFARLIKTSLKDNNQFICVGPYFNYSDKDNRMNDFLSLMMGNVNYYKSFDTNSFDAYDCTAQILCFSVGSSKKPIIVISDEKTLAQLVKEQNSAVEFIKSNKSEKLFFKCGDVQGYVSPSAHKKVLESDCRLDDFKYAKISVNDSIAIPCIMISNKDKQ